MKTYLPILILFIVAAGFIVMNMIATHLLGPSRHSAVKDEVFECGIPSVNNARLPFSIKYFVLAIMFVVFDVEIVFFYPWATAFKSLGWTGYIEMIVFMAFVAVGLLYLFKHRVLDFEKDTQEALQ